MNQEARLRASSRASGALWGAIVTAVGLTCIAVYSGRKIDLELLGISLLGVAGAWLLLSAVASGLSSRGSRRTAAELKRDMLDDAGELHASAWRKAREAASVPEDIPAQPTPLKSQPTA